MSETDESRDLTECGCCEVQSLAYPLHYNRPGLDALSYRLATHGGFVARMLGRLTHDQLPELTAAEPAQNTTSRDLRPLAKLTTRDPSDPAIALLDAWACVADVLTFYQERIANEGFLRTARERRSVLELARSIGYELKPGVAASTVLAFTADGSKDSPPEVKIAKGARVLSIPSKDELPQTFETIEEIVARAQWNSLKPYVPILQPPNPIARSVDTLYLKGTGTGLRAGDAILIVGKERQDRPGDEHWDFRILQRVEIVPEKACTRITFSVGLGDQHPTKVGPAQVEPHVHAFRLRASLFGHNAAEWDKLDPAIKLRAAPRSLEVVTGVAFSPKVEQALCSTVDGTLRLWDSSSRHPLLCMEGHIGSVNCVAYSPDGRFAISGGDDATVRVWEVATGRQVRKFAAHRGPVLSVAAGAYEQEYREAAYVGEAVVWTTKVRTKIVAVSGGADADIHAWDLEELPPDQSPLIKTLTGHNGGVNALALHVAGKLPVSGTGTLVQRLVAGGDDGKVLLWNLQEGTSQTLATHAGAVHAAAISAQGTRLASGGADGQLKTWELQSNGSWPLHGTYTHSTAESITALAFAPSLGAKLVVGALGRATVGVAIKVDAAAKSNGVLLLLDWASGQLAPSSEAAHSGPVLAVAWSALKAQIASGGADRQLLLWNSLLKDPHTLASSKPEAVGEWPDFDLKVDRADPQLELDTLYPSIVPGSWIVLARPGYAEAYRVRDSEVRWANSFGLSSKLTRLSIDSAEHVSWFGRRNTTVYAQSEPLELHSEQRPDRSPLHGRSITLATLVQGLERGRRVVVSGQRMRARFSNKGQEKFSLIAADGYSSRELRDGDLLVCLSPPYPDRPDYAVREWSEQAGGFVPVLRCDPSDAQGSGTSNKDPGDLQLTWRLRDRNGFEGSLTTQLAARADGSFQGTYLTVLRPQNKEENLVSEVAVIYIAEDLRARLRLHFAAELANLFDSETLSINANVARATHGETVAREVLGSGDGTLANQRFTLRKKPLTYVSAPNASGGDSTLELRVNDVLWQEVATLHDLDARSQSYLVRRDDDSNSTIIFGDGVRGARLPTGQENITAAYRSGLGPQGEVAAGVIKLLQTKPLGIREAVNPIPASGAAAAESLAEARAHAPLTVLTFDRIVSLKDYEDFAAGFAGVGKAQASGLWNGMRQLVHLTVGTASGKPLASDSDLYENLSAAFTALRDVGVQVRMQGFVLLHFKLTAALRVDARYRREQVEAQIRAALLTAFSFASREFGQAVTRAEVTTIIQSVGGVIAVNLTHFAYLDSASNEVEELLPAQRASWDREKATTRPAQLLLLYPAADGITFAEMPV